MAAAAPRRIEIVPWGFWKSATGGGTIARVQVSSYLGGGVVRQQVGSEAVNDEITWDVLLDSGTWALDVIYFKSTDRGIQTWYLDSTSLGTVDGYGASSANNVSTLSGITVAAAGTYTLKCKVESKHASSSSYYYTLHHLVLRRTGA